MCPPLRVLDVIGYELQWQLLAQSRYKKVLSDDLALNTCAETHGGCNGMPEFLVLHQKRIGHVL